MGWEDQLWSELEAMPPAERIIAVGETITRISQKVLVDLARYRRVQAVALIDSGEYSYAGVADAIGARTGAVRRLVEEGRRTLREEDALETVA